MDRLNGRLNGPAAATGTSTSGPVMTIGQLSRRTGVSVKALRRYEGMGLIYTVGRSPAGYRLFDDDALWCVQVIGNLRGLGLTVAEIRQLAGVYLDQPDQPIGPHLADRLRAVRARLEARIAELEQLRRRIDRFEASHQAELGCAALAPPTATPTATATATATARAAPTSAPRPPRFGSTSMSRSRVRAAAGA